MDKWSIELDTGGVKPSPFWGSALHGMLMEALPESWRKELHGEEARPFSQWLECIGESDAVWHIQSRNDELSECVDRALSDAEVWSLKKGGCKLRTKGITRQSVSLKDYMKPFFIAEKPQRIIKLTFQTTTGHRSGGEYVNFPSVGLLVNSLSGRFLQIDPSFVYADEEVREQIARATRITRYRLQSGAFFIDGAKVSGFTGWITLSMRGPESLVRLASMLYSFAAYSGVGIKTALGMGGCTVEQIEEGE